MTSVDNAGHLKHPVGRKIKCQHGLTIYFIPGFLDEQHILPSKNLNFDSMLVRQMFMLHNTLGEAYPANYAIGYGSEGY